MEILSFGDDAGGQVVGEGTWNFDSEVTCFVSDKASKVSGVAHNFFSHR